jgi:hypothetical protein
MNDKTIVEIWPVADTAAQKLGMRWLPHNQTSKLSE